MRINKKLAVAASVTGILALGAGTAVAYWTTGGTGSGEGTAASSVTDVNVTLSIADGIVPGGSSNVSIKVANPNPKTSVYFNDIVQKGAVAFDDEHLGCSAADFSFASLEDLNKTLAPNDDAAGGSDEFTTTGALSMANTAVSQDACKGAKITLTLQATT